MTTNDKEVDVVHEIALFERRIRVENAAPAAWEADWGFLRSKESRAKDLEIEEFEKSHLPSPVGLPGEDSGPFFERVRIWKSMEPKSKFCRPVLASHEIGWRPPIDLFGPKQFGVHRNPELFPARRSQH